LIDRSAIITNRNFILNTENSADAFFMNGDKSVLR